MPQVPLDLGVVNGRGEERPGRERAEEVVVRGADLVRAGEDAVGDPPLEARADVKVRRSLAGQELAGMCGRAALPRRRRYPRRHLMPQPTLGFCPMDGALPDAIASTAAPRSRPVTAFPFEGRLSSSWP